MEQIARTAGTDAQPAAGNARNHTEVLLLDGFAGGPQIKHDKVKPPKKKIDPIYGEDAADRFVADNFDKKNPFVFKNVSPGEAAKHKDLSIFVNLSANRGLLNSSLREDEELRKLEQLTKDKPVTVVVQVAMNRDRSLNHLRATQADRIISNLGGLDPDVKQTEVVRYEIANGSKKLLYSGYSKGLTGDLADLLGSDPAAMKADRVMLFNRAHGMAMHGLRGDAGNTSVPDLKSTLSTALGNAGRTKFDLVDLDSCLMGNAQALTELAPVAKYLIASEEPEVAVAKLDLTEQGKSNDDAPTANAQPLAEAVKKMIVNSPSGLKAAVTEVFLTNQEQCHKVSPDGLCGANTLGLYDEAFAPQFSASLDRFGAALNDASRNPGNMAEFQKDAQLAPVIDGEPDGLKHTVKRRDLADFAAHIKEGLTSGQIIDASTHDLDHAVTQLQSDMSQLVAQNFNSYNPSLKQRFEEVHLPAMQLGGISVFLQERQAKDMQIAFDKQSSEDSISSQPNWNKFVVAMGEPL